ncbi:copper-containing nitrite reductase [Aestuariivirga litoralis]|uniref:copper-containing nitrite reductase n=1 Tax=Aestuariivirga litoralis TaxID=2650924 RepID=UPI001FEE8B93|nr:copper-containing nitrite reductase [Aestuariivirga litoralis]
MTNNNGFQFSRRSLLGVGAMTAAAATLASTPARADDAAVDVSKLPRIKQTLVAPPNLPQHDLVAKTGPVIVEVAMTIEEKKIVIDKEGTEIWAFAFNGTVPGPMIVCHEGDYVELTLRSLATNMMEHNIDFHASTGALGGGALTKILPGQEVVLRWKAIKAGVFVYHCAPGDVMIPYHVVHGMNGAVMVLPRDGLKDGKGNALKYDMAYYVGEQDFYIPRDEKGAFKKYETAGEDLPESLDVMRTLIPSHVVFNGAVGSLTGDNAMKAKVGETLLIIHAQANRDTRPHLIGGHADYVWEHGKFANAPDTDYETWFIRGGSAGAALYKFRQPGIYAYVNHNLIEAVMLGATAHFKVDGQWSDDLMMQVAKPRPITG